jgi:hypothetical protein
MMMSVDTEVDPRAIEDGPPPFRATEDALSLVNGSSQASSFRHGDVVPPTTAGISCAIQSGLPWSERWQWVSFRVNGQMSKEWAPVKASLLVNE